MSEAGLASLLPLPIALPITGAILAPLVSRVSCRAALVVSVATTAAATAVLALFAPRAYRGQVVTTFLGHWVPVHGSALGIALDADAFGLTFALVTGAVGTVLLLYTLSELGELGPRELGGYACLFQLLLAALIGSALTADSVDLFVWFEVAALSSYGLTAFFLERPLALEAAFKILTLTSIASFVVFDGTALLYSDHGALNLGQLHIALTGHVDRVSLVGLALLVGGFAVKAGLMPFHGWLADAHTAAPGPVSALFSGLMVNLGVVAIARLVLDVYATGARPMLGVLTVIGCVSALLGAVMALAQDDLKRLLAYDTVSQTGVLVVGLGTGSAGGLAGMTYHLVSHALFKSLLFLAAGSIVHATGLTNLSEMGGLARRRPVTTVAFMLGAAAIAGVPPLNGYVSLGLIHDALRHTDPAAFVVMLAAQVVTVAALARASYLAFFRGRGEAYESLRPARPGMRVAFVVLAVGCVVFGVLGEFVLHHVAEPAAGVLTDPRGYARAVLGVPTRVPAASVRLEDFSAAGLGTALGTIAVGLALAAWYVRRPREPRAISALRALHTGSVNDYASMAVGGIAVVAVALLVGH